MADSIEVTRDVELPEPPVPLAVSDDPDVRAVMLASALEHHGAGRLAATLAVFKLAGVPVMDGSGSSLTTDGDTVGVPWALVWSAARVPNPDARIPLSQVGQLLTTHANGLDAAAVSETLRTGLAEAQASSPDIAGPGALARLVDEESTRAGGLTVADPAASPDRVLISSSTFAALVTAGLLTTVVGPELKLPAPPESPTPPPSGCAEDTAGQVALWIMSKVAGGVEVVGDRGWQGPFRSLLDHISKHDWYRSGDLPVDVSDLKSKLETAAGVAGYLAAALSALGLTIALLTQTAKVTLMEGEPLRRTDSTIEDGEPKTVLVVVGTDYGAIDPERIRGLNCVLVMLVLLGNNTTFPVPGVLPGVTVKVRGGLGFGERLNTRGSFVLLPGGLTRTADDGGRAMFPVTGRMQASPVPPGSPMFDRRFSVHVEATADPADVWSITKVFLDDVLCAVSPIVKPFACVDAVGNTVKQFYWDMGEESFELTDWQRERPLFVVDAFSSTTTARTESGGIGGKTRRARQFVASNPPLVSRVKPSCDPSNLCPVSLHMLQHEESTLSGFDRTRRPDCLFGPETITSFPDPYTGSVGVPLPADGDETRRYVLDGPNYADVSVGSISDESCLYAIPNDDLPAVASQQELDPAVMRSGASVTLTWFAEGEVSSVSFNVGNIRWTWDQFVTFHRVNEDGSRYAPPP
ncbi:MAG: hypothetical protein M3R63_06860 [Actinomycetota bacterium]|nr:hypothetical protein [Actinomycetota bacterium]